MFTNKFMVRNSQTSNLNIANVIKQLLQKENQEIVENEQEANYIIEVRNSHENRNSQNISIGGSVTGGIVNIAGTQTISGNVSINTTPEDDKNLTNLLTELQMTLAQAPADKATAAEAVQTNAQAVVKEATEQRKSNEITRENLQKAASNLASVMPTVGVIVYQILAFVAKLSS